MENQSQQDLAADDAGSRRSRAWTRVMGRAATSRIWVRKSVLRDREVQLTRQDQLTLAWMGHLLVIAGVFIIVHVTFGGGTIHHSIHYFYVAEGLIIGFGILAAASTRQIVSALGGNDIVNLDWTEDWMNRNPTLKVRAQGWVLDVMFVLQFASMAALLVATGGPIDSPFVPMALGIGVFTPFIVNKWWTVVVVICATAIFYVSLALIVGFDGAKGHPGPLAYAMVNVFVLILGSVMTFKRRNALTFKVIKMFPTPPEPVWQALTDEEQVLRWISGDSGPSPEISLDVQQDGVWQVRMSGSGGRAGIPWSGRYLEVEEPRRLVFTVSARSGRGREVIAVDLKKRGEATELVLTQSDQGRLDGLKKGWSKFINRMWYVATTSHERPRDRDE
jgi:uncharacterized protein YndB with AHSA1/START domain